MTRTAFFTSDAEAIGITYRQVQVWDETGLCKPNSITGRRRVYDLDRFRRLALVKELAGRGMTQKAKRILPAVTLPQSDCWVITDGREHHGVESEPLKALQAIVASRKPVCVVHVPLDVLGARL